MKTYLYFFIEKAKKCLVLKRMSASFSVIILGLFYSFIISTATYHPWSRCTPLPPRADLSSLVSGDRAADRGREQGAHRGSHEHEQRVVPVPRRLHRHLDADSDRRRVRSFRRKGRMPHWVLCSLLFVVKRVTGFPSNGPPPRESDGNRWLLSDVEDVLGGLGGVRTGGQDGSRRRKAQRRIQY